MRAAAQIGLTEVWYRYREVIAIWVMSTVAGSGFLAVLEGPTAALVAATGSLIAVLAFVLGSRYRLIAPEVVLVSFAAFLVVGGLISGPVPLPSSYAAFVRGLLSGWADLLSSVIPADATPENRVLPYTIGWLAALIALELRRVTRAPGVVLVGPLIGFSVTILFNPQSLLITLSMVGAICGVGLVAGFIDQRNLGFARDERVGLTTMASRRRRSLGGALLAGVAVLAAVTASPYVPTIDETDRFNLRDHLTPPWDALDEPSPLASLKSNYASETSDEVAFVAQTRNGAPLPRRWAMATLADFDGVVWTLGDTAIGGRAEFVPIDARTPAAEELESQFGVDAAVEVVVEAVAIDGPWLPLPGKASYVWTADMGAVSGQSLDDSKPLGSLDQSSEGALRFNPRSGTVALPSGLGKGYAYAARVHSWPEHPDSVMRNSAMSADQVGLDLDLQASEIRNASADLLQGVDGGWSQVEALRDGLREGGSYLADDRAKPGHSWARLGDFLSGDIIYGFEEQYAAAAAIIARNAGMPARVVVGYVLPEGVAGPGPFEVRRSYASAWIEVETVEHGWVPVDVTPDRDKAPELTEDLTDVVEVAAPNPPPAPPPPPEAEVEQETEDETELDEPEEEALAGVPVLVVVGVLSVVVPLLALAAFAVLVLFAKALRRRRRRAASEPHLAVAGAWSELRDRYSEVGLRPADSESLSELEGRLLAEGAVPGPLAVLVGAIDQATFAPETTRSVEAAAAWESSELLVSSLREQQGLWTRIRMRLSPAPMREARARARSRKSSVASSSRSLRSAGHGSVSRITKVKQRSKS